MKKVLSFVLVLSMILGSFGMAFAAAPSDVVGKDYEDAVNVLMELGVVEGYKDGTFRPEKVVTRAEMATLIIKALGLNDYAVGKSSFSDMAGHWADAYVAYAASLGFISGYGDGTFRPNQTVTYDQAITMVVQALGYKGEYLVGGYPGAFVAQAKTLGMLDGIKSGVAGANRGDVATLLFNTLPVSFVRYDKNGSLENIVLKGDKNDTMMQRLGASLYSPTGEAKDAGKEFVVTGDEKSVINLKEYQGAYVTAYVNKDGKIIAIEEVKSEFITGDVDVKDDNVITLADDTEYKLDRVLTDKVVKFVNGEMVVDGNGDAVLSALTTADDVTLAVELSGKYVDELYSISIWTAEDTIQWDEDNAEELADDDKLEGKKFAMTDDDEIDMDELVLVGVASLKDIKEDDIVTYYLANDKVVKVEVSSATVEGKITKITGKGTDAKYTIAGKSYKSDLIDGEDALELSDEGTFYLNYAGKIAAFEGVSEDTNYAVIIKKAGKDGSSYDSDATNKIKLLTADDKEVVFVLTDKANDTLKDQEVGTVISYVLNSDGEIKSAELKNPTVGAKIYKKGLLDGYKIAKDAFVYTYDSDDKEYNLSKVADIPANETLKSTKYLLKDGEVVVIFSTDVAEEDGIYGVVTDFGKVKNADDETVWEVSVLVDGKAVTYYCDDDKFDAVATLYAFTVSGEDDLTALKAQTAKEIGTVYSVTAEGNILFEKNGSAKVVADDVVVYLINDDGDMELSSLKKIGKGDKVWLYDTDELDGNDDENGFDIIIFEAE